MFPAYYGIGRLYYGCIDIVMPAALCDPVNHATVVATLTRQPVCAPFYLRRQLCPPAGTPHRGRARQHTHSMSSRS
jgi:hypothetical protein